ncbi:hypothetical protein CVD28_11695 [Bacillus sp. M6-12]|nr:hypothetical protein CVD28_11695 [Bacillus sp. M6-12]
MGIVPIVLYGGRSLFQHRYGTAKYVVKTEKETQQLFIIKDGKFPGYSFIPVISDLNGCPQGIVHLLNWMMPML